MSKDKKPVLPHPYTEEDEMALMEFLRTYRNVLDRYGVTTTEMMLLELMDELHNELSLN